MQALAAQVAGGLRAPGRAAWHGDDLGGELAAPRFASRPNTPVLERTGSFGSYADIDLLEAGTGKEVLRAENLVPASPRHHSLRRHSFERRGKDRFFLREDGSNRVMLSAKLGRNNNFYISQYEEFPEHFSEATANQERAVGDGGSFVAVLRLDPRAAKFRLFSCSCEGCDQALGLHTCGKDTVDNGDRQLLMELGHATEAVGCGDDLSIDCNVVRLKIPMVFSDRSRDCWCARFGGGANRQGRKVLVPTSSGRSLLLGGQSKQLRREDPQADPRCEDGPASGSDARSPAGCCEAARKLRRTHSAPSQPLPLRVLAGDATAGACVIVSRKPRFDSATGSLRMKFLNNRVRQASSKNLIFCLDKNSAGPRGARPKPPPADAVVAQFGKVDEGRYSLDFRFPLAPIQAFALGLSLFRWQAGDPR